MHVLTKVFVVLAAVLSIVLSALTIAYATNMDRIRRDYDAQRTRLAAVEDSQGVASAQREAEVARLNQSISSLQAELSKVRGELSNLQSQRSELIVARDRAEADRAAAQAQIDQATELGKTQASLLKAQSDEVSQLRRNELTFRTQRVELEDAVSDLQSQREVLEQNYRALQEELAQLRRDVQTGGASAGAVAGSDRPFDYSGPVIVGRVESVQQDPATQRQLAKLTVGSNDRVTKNMRMRVLRDNNFVGNLVITESDLSFSVGLFDALGKPMDVRAGDVVVSRIQ